MKDLYRYFDKFSFIILVALVSMGIVIIFSASSGMDRPYGVRQLIWLAVSLAGFALAFRIKTEVFFRYAIFFYLFMAAALIVQMLVGEITAGTKSWIKTGLFNIQVSEFVKVPLAIYLAKILTKMSTIKWKEFFQLLAIIGVPFILIVLQPDMGTAFMLVSFFIAVILLKGIKPSIIVIFLIFLTAGFYVTRHYVFNMLKPYQKERIVSFFDPQKYKKSTGYQIIQSKIAIGSGGLTGKGYLKGTQSQYQFLPTRHTDFIVSVLGEEWGFLGISFLFLLFFILFYRQFNFKAQTDEEFYYVYLFNGIILFQFLVNILMSIGFFPVMGIPLPFVSYGGSSLLAFFIGEGLIFRVKINTYWSEY